MTGFRSRVRSLVLVRIQLQDDNASLERRLERGVAVDSEAIGRACPVT
jgi:hypothetical protein